MLLFFHQRVVTRAGVLLVQRKEFELTEERANDFMKKVSENDDIFPSVPGTESLELPNRSSKELAAGEPSRISEGRAGRGGIRQNSLPMLEKPRVGLTEESMAPR